MAKAPTLKPSTVAKHVRKMLARLESALAWGNGCCHLQIKNIKTGSYGEGAAAVLTCLHGVWSDWTADGVRRGIAAGVIPPCALSCYAFRQMIQYKLYRAAMLKNTAIRRASPADYYRLFFEKAQESAAQNLRLNESGDFETKAQARTALKLAAKYPAVKVWGYTQRPPEWIEKAPKNCTIRVSCWTDERRAADLERRGFKTAVVVDDLSRATCPAQIAKARGQVWTCAMCAARGVGCCGSAKRINFAKH